MDADSITTPALVTPDHIIRCGLNADHSQRHRFGEPLEVDVARWPKGWPSPHRVITLDFNDPLLNHFGPDQWSSWFDRRIPLIYPYRVGGARIKYESISHGQLWLTASDGDKDSIDWPYRDYPVIFPTAPLTLSKPEPIEWQRLEDDGDWQGLTWQDSRPEPGQLLVVVPPNDAYGVSLWGEAGDLEGVQTMFRVDFAKKTIEAWNECT